MSARRLGRVSHPLVFVYRLRVFIALIFKPHASPLVVLAPFDQFRHIFSSFRTLACAGVLRAFILLSCVLLLLEIMVLECLGRSWGRQGGPSNDYYCGLLG